MKLFRLIYSMVHNCWALLRGLWLILTTDTNPLLPFNSTEQKESWGSWDSNEHIHD